MKTRKKICLGVIADDFTGAGDAASFLVKRGMKTILYTRIPDALPDEDYDCIVIALKSRSVKPKEAILQTKEALHVLKKAKVEHYYFKYCSTFDSTPSGNIGVVLDYLMTELKVPYTILCPSLPVNGRTLKKGILYVNGVPLSESSMKHHPLNPMWDSFIPTLMKEQSQFPCYLISREMLENKLVFEKIQEYQRNHEKFYLVPDYENDDDATLICDAFKDLRLMSGGSGLLEHLSYQEGMIPSKLSHQSYHKAIILCGSCSDMSRKQIQNYRSQGGITYPIDSKKLRDGTLCAKDVFDEVHQQEKTVLIYSDAIDKNMEELSKAESFLFEAKLIENLMSDISIMANAKGYDKIIVAGGETSGAVTKALGYGAYQIGDVIAPGVPTLRPIDHNKLNLILKSGNFGDENFFEKALGMEEKACTKK